MAKESIGIMGGTFDPIHGGHIRMAQAARRAANLDTVLMIPDKTPPHKADVSPAEDRWRMVCAACAQEEGLEPCRMELDREGITYSEDTLTALHEMHPKAEFYFIIGADTVTELKKWHNYRHVLTLCTFLVCPRKISVTSAEYTAAYRSLTDEGARLVSIDMENANVSSTEVRKALSEHRACALLSPVIREYAEITGLYGMAARIPEAEIWLKRLFRDLSAKRFAHTLAVAATARNLALHHQVDPIKAEKAALLHDCAKCLPLEEMRKIYTDSGKEVDETLLESGNLLHSASGAVMAETVYGIHDGEILRAISSHTTGRPGMSRLEMVVYLADKIEPTRAAYPLLDKVRMLSLVSLEKAMLASMDGTANYVKKGGKPLHPQTKRTIAWLKTLPDIDE